MRDSRGFEWPQGSAVRSTGGSHREKEFRYTQEERSKSQRYLERERAVLIGSELPISGKLQSGAA